MPDGVTTGAATATSTLSAAALLSRPSGEPSRATIESDRVVVFVLVVEKVTDCKAVWYWATRSAAGQCEHAAGVAAADAVLIGEIERIARLIVVDRHAGARKVGVDRRNH